MTDRTFCYRNNCHEMSTYELRWHRYFAEKSQSRAKDVACDRHARLSRAWARLVPIR